ncbi:MAG: Tol-Pal system beta propeller repeat protein TolB [Gammaproteobacteria bacterium]|jgi:TolB protein
MMQKRYIVLLLLVMISPPLWSAPLTIEITQGVESALPIAIVPFGEQGARKPPTSVAEIIASDLKRTGRFDPMRAKDMLAQPTKPEDIKFQNWRLMQREALVIGNVKYEGNNSYSIGFRLYDVYQAKELTAYNVVGKESSFRAAAHKISDIIYEKLTGEPGAFSTQIAYITATPSKADKTRKDYSLWMADADGYNPQVLLKSKEPIYSPTWSPDGKKLAYVSHERGGQQRIVIQQWSSGARKILTVPLKGRQSSPSWSPDGKKLAFTNHKDGNAEIYVLDLASKKVRQITRHWAIETEAVWTPDGKSIIFTSDRGGRPQLYKTSSTGGRTSRLTFEGVENARAAVSPDGKMVAMVSALRNEATRRLEYKIAVMELETGYLNVLTDGKLDESPSFAPNGSMVIYATTTDRGQGQLAAVSVDGSIRQKLSTDDDVDEVREPAWSPLNKK